MDVSCWRVPGSVVAGAGVGALVLVMGVAGSGAQEAAARQGGWTIPPAAAQEQSPLPSSPQALAAGRALFQKNCQRCHGPKGVGDGPDADPDYMADMDLTNPKRADHNPDGVVFYKVWNGRKKPKMPAFKEELSREQVWAIVAYVQTLRKDK
ncbi:MAG: c-type cytochrome [Acidobacteria bacterium]|nr:c-type cytochrome [Acidobacteriota bacterium]